MNSKKRNVNYPPEMKADAVKRYLNGTSAQELAKEIGCHVTSINQWVHAAVKDGKAVVKKRGKVKVGLKTYDAIVYLRHAKDAMKVQIAADPSRLDDPAYLFSMLALKTLEGQA